MQSLKNGLLKLTLKAFKGRERQPGKLVGSMTAMYNPQAIQLSYSAVYVPQAFVNESRQSNRFQQVQPGGLNLELVFDAQLPGTSASIDAQLAALRKLCFNLDDETGEPHFLEITWGSMTWHGKGFFAGRTRALDVNYPLFDRDATPLRATARLSLLADTAGGANKPPGASMPSPGGLADELKSAAGGASRGGEGGSQGAGTPMPAFSVRFGIGAGHALKHFKPADIDLQLAINKIPSARLSFTLAGDVADDYKPVEEDMQACAIGTNAVVMSGDKPLFGGLVVSQEFELRQGMRTLILGLKHPLQRLTATHRTQVFARETDQQILERILQKDHKIKVLPLGVLPTSATVDLHEQMVQYNCSDWDFVRSRVAANGVWVVPLASGAAEIGLPKLKPVAQHTLMATQPGKDRLIEEGLWRFSNLVQPTGVYVSSWDVAKQKMTGLEGGKEETLGAGALDPGKFKGQSLGGSIWTLVRSGVFSAKEAVALASGRLLAQRAMGVQGRFTVNGRGDYALGDTLELKGFGKTLDGRALISGVEHKFRASENLWRTTLSLGLDASRDIDEPVVPEIKGLHVGIVEAYEKDPRPNWDRVRLHVPVLGNTVLRARLGKPYASDHSGMCFYPEPGDEVLLGFFEDDPRFPVVLGAMHNPKKITPFDPGLKGVNSRKGVILKNGKGAKEKQEWIFDREEPSVTLDTGEEKLIFKKGVQLTSDEGDIAVSTKKNLVFAVTEDATLTADKTWSAEGKKDVALKSGSGRLSLSPESAELKAMEFKAEASNAMTLKGAGAQLSLTAPEAKLQAPNVALNGNAKVDVKGTMVDVGP